MCGGGSKCVLVFLKCRSAFKNEYTTSVLKKSRAGYDLRHTPSARFSSGAARKVNDDGRDSQIWV